MENVLKYVKYRSELESEKICDYVSAKTIYRRFNTRMYIFLIRIKEYKSN